MRQRRVLIGTVLVVVFTLVGCGGQGTPGASGTTPTGSAAVGTPGAQSDGPAGGPIGGSSTGPSDEPSGDGIGYRVTYPFAVPSSPVTITNPHPPLGTPPAPALPYLVGVYVGNHPDEDPAYQRISYYFRGGFPSYRFGYVPQVVSDGAGVPVSLEGNRFLQVVFVDAQAHDDSGASTIARQPTNPIGMPNLRSFGFAGDFEGYVSYGLGIQGPAPLPIRAGELTRPDGQGGTFYVVHFDVRTT